MTAHVDRAALIEERDELRSLLRDVLMDYAPEFYDDYEETDCVCSAHRAHRYLAANGRAQRGRIA